jgi:hypothetical protein
VKFTAIALAVTLSSAFCAASAQKVAPKDSQNSVSRSATETIDGKAIAGCIGSVRRLLPRLNQSVPAGTKALVPVDSYIRLVQPLSETDTLVIYEIGNWTRYWERFAAGKEGGELTDPDTRLLITRQGSPVFRYAFKELQPSGHHDDWGISAVAMSTAHLCSDTLDITYLVVQSGNAGGFFMALQRSGEGYKMIPISDADQGRLVLSLKNIGEVQVWTADDTGVCEACGKPFIVKTLELSGEQYREVSRHRTHKEYSSFQDRPLAIKP